jgi:small nuclear ribonucleoprotein (snRNP)-like protein
MNLVIDDAVEVKQATKTEEEKRRNLGKSSLLDSRGSWTVTNLY